MEPVPLPPRRRSGRFARSPPPFPSARNLGRASGSRARARDGAMTVQRLRFAGRRRLAAGSRRAPSAPRLFARVRRRRRCARVRLSRRSLLEPGVARAHGPRAHGARNAQRRPLGQADDRPRDRRRPHVQRQGSALELRRASVLLGLARRSRPAARTARRPENSRPHRRRRRGGDPLRRVRAPPPTSSRSCSEHSRDRRT